MNEKNQKTKSIFEKTIISLFFQFAIDFFNALTQSFFFAISMLLTNKKINKSQMKKKTKIIENMIQNNINHQKTLNNNEYEKKNVLNNFEQKQKDHNGNSKEKNSKNEKKK